jgi:hypothetical protein
VGLGSGVEEGITSAFAKTGGATQELPIAPTELLAKAPKLQQGGPGQGGLGGGNPFDPTRQGINNITSGRNLEEFGPEGDPDKLRKLQMLRMLGIL